VKYLSTADVRCNVSTPDVVPPHHLNAETRRNLFLAVKEALHNVVKHAAASEVSLTLAVGDAELTLAIDDNGKGFSQEAAVDAGNGLENMRRRLVTVGGSCDIRSVPGRGTRVLLRYPLAAEVWR
jgi:signal transduction histidine kinase